MKRFTFVISLLLVTILLVSCNSPKVVAEPAKTEYYGVARFVNGEMIDPVSPPNEDCYFITYDIPDPQIDENIMMWIPPYQEPNLDVSDKAAVDRLAQFYLEMKGRQLEKKGFDFEIPEDYSYSFEAPK